MGQTRMFRDRVVSMEQTFEGGEKHLALLKGICSEALPDFVFREHSLDHERDLFVMDFDAPDGARRRVCWTRMVLFDAERIPTLEADPAAALRAKIVALVRGQAAAGCPEILVTFRHLEEGWVDTPEPRREGRRRRRGGRGGRGRGEGRGRRPSRVALASGSGVPEAGLRAARRRRPSGAPPRSVPARSGPGRRPSDLVSAAEQGQAGAGGSGAAVGAAAGAVREARRRAPGRRRRRRDPGHELRADRRPEAHPRCCARVRRGRDRAAGGAVGEGRALPPRDPRPPRRDGRDGDDDPRSLRRGGRRRRVVRARDRGARARLRLDGGHRFGEQLGGLLSDLEVRHRGAEDDDPEASSPRAGRSAPTP